MKRKKIQNFQNLHIKFDFEIHFKSFQKIVIKAKSDGNFYLCVQSDHPITFFSEYFCIFVNVFKITTNVSFYGTHN